MTSAADGRRPCHCGGDSGGCACDRSTIPKPVSRARIISGLTPEKHQAYIVQERVPFLWFWTRWVRYRPNHSIWSLEDAKRGLEDLKRSIKYRDEAKANKGKVIVEE